MEDAQAYRYPNAAEIAAMTDAERKKLSKQLREILKELNTTPRSDWHRSGFEPILRMEMHPYGDNIKILTEHPLGEEPPRIDYIILEENEYQPMKKAIYHIFRKHNIIEFKNPHDSLDERVIQMIIAYGSAYIGYAPHAGEIPRDQVTLSIFRAKKPEALFRTMMSAGELVATAEPGIYRVEKLTSLPFQIVITSELEGPEYAAYRALVDNEEAREEDIRQIVEESSQTTDSALQRYFQEFIDFIGKKNPQTFEAITGGDKDMGEYLMNLLKPRIEKEKEEAVQAAVQVAVQAAVQNNAMQNLYYFVQDGGMTIDYASKWANQTPAAFIANMRKAGFRVPEART